MFVGLMNFLFVVPFLHCSLNSVEKLHSVFATVYLEVRSKTNLRECFFGLLHLDEWLSDLFVIPLLSFFFLSDHSHPIIRFCIQSQFADYLLTRAVFIYDERSLNWNRFFKSVTITF